MFNALYRQLLGGDGIALDDFQGLLHRRLIARLKRRFGGRIAPWQIEDVAFDSVQETLRQYEDFRSWQAAECYVFRAAVSQCLEQIRRARSAQFSELNPDRDEIHGVVRTEGLGSENSRVEIADELEWLLERSTPREGCIILAAARLVLQEGKTLSVRALASRTGLSRWKVAEALLRIRERTSLSG